MPQPTLPAVPTRRPSDAPRIDTPTPTPAHPPLSRPAAVPASRPGTDRRISPAASPFTFRRASSTTTKAASNSGRHAPRRPGGSASPPPSTTSARPGASAGSPSGSSRCAGRGSRASARRTWRGSTRWATRIMQADEALYLHPRRSRVSGPAIDVDNDPRPDVVLEVDHTTDVRRRKLGIYEAWGFPEVWVLVPPESRLRTPGLDIQSPRRPVSGGAGEQRVSGVAGGGDLPGSDRRPAVAAGEAGPGASRPSDGSPRGHPAGGRSDHPLDQPAGGGTGQGERPPGGDGGERARGAPRPWYRGYPRPRPGSGPLRRASG